MSPQQNLFRTTRTDLETQTYTWLGGGGAEMHLWTPTRARLQEFITLRRKLNSLLIEKTEDLLHLAAHYY